MVMHAHTHTFVFISHTHKKAMQLSVSGVRLSYHLLTSIVVHTTDFKYKKQYQATLKKRPCLHVTVVNHSDGRRPTMTRNDGTSKLGTSTSRLDFFMIGHIMSDPFNKE